MTGSVVLGQLFVAYGWTACVVGIAVALMAAALLAARLRVQTAPVRDVRAA